MTIPQLRAGSFAIGPSTGPMTLRTHRTGLGAAAGHDLVIEVTRWHGTVRVARAVESSSVEVVVDATSFEVREGIGGAVPLLAINKADILRTISRLLQTSKHRELRYTSGSVAVTDEGFLVDGELTIAGVTRPVQLTVAVASNADGLSGSVTTTVLHSDFGIRPYSAMLGALKVADAVDVRAEVRLG